MRKLFYQSVITKDRSGLEVDLHDDTIAAEKFPIKPSRVVKGEIDNYCDEEDSTNELNGVAFFHEKATASMTSSSSVTAWAPNSRTAPDQGRAYPGAAPRVVHGTRFELAR